MNWKSIPGYEGHYEVSDTGLVRSLDRWIEHRGNSSNGGRFQRGRLLKPSVSNGYHHMVQLSARGVPKVRLVHRLVLAAFVGPCPDGMVACHNDGNPINKNVENLRWDTQSSNIRDAVKHGTQRQVRKTHCPKGHPYDAENTYWRPDRYGRMCRACCRIADQKPARRHRNRKKAA